MFGLFELFRLGVITRFRLNSAYWQWRRKTAFGSDPAKWPSRREQRQAAIAYGAWVHQMKRLRDS
jgi:hypothetical protein